MWLFFQLITFVHSTLAWYYSKEGKKSDALRDKEKNGKEGEREEKRDKRRRRKRGHERIWKKIRLPPLPALFFLLTQSYPSSLLLPPNTPHPRPPRPSFTPSCSILHPGGIIFSLLMGWLLMMVVRLLSPSKPPLCCLSSLWGVRGDGAPMPRGSPT